MKERAASLRVRGYGHLEVTNTLLEEAHAAGVLPELLLLPTLCLSVEKGHLAVVNALLEAAKAVHMLPELLMRTKLVLPEMLWFSCIWALFLC